MATATRSASTAQRLESTFPPGSARESGTNGRRQGAATATDGATEKLRQHRGCLLPAKSSRPGWGSRSMPFETSRNRVSGVVLGDYPRATIKEILTVARGPASGGTS